MNILICGGRTIAVSCLKYLIESGENIIGVVANPNDDGKDKWWTVSFRRVASEMGLDVWQPPSINDPEFLSIIEPLKVDAILSVLYSRILKSNTLSLPSFGCFNIHYALLPRHRGCYTLINAIYSGDEKTGVTIHRMDSGIDTGPIIAQRSVLIDSSDSAFTLRMKCSAAAAEVFQSVWPSVAAGTFSEIQQDESGACYNRKVIPNEGWISWDWTDRQIDLLIRALTFPGYYEPAKFMDGNMIRTACLYSPGYYAVDGSIMDIASFFKRFRYNCHQNDI